MPDSEIKFCVCASIDLQGFSQHLELGAHDIRTNIGEEAIKRLENLTEAIKLIEKEENTCDKFYPENLYYTRINDALIFNLDLPSDLMPDIGQQIKKGYSVLDLEEKFDIDDYESTDELEEAIHESYQENTSDLQKFVGLIARIHQFINEKEDQSYFPGAKTIISLGQRKPFFTNGEDDQISANFAFANAFKAETKLSGPSLFIDNNILKLLSVSQPCQNLAKLAIREEYEEDNISLFESNKKAELTPIKEIELFRKTFHFRKTNPNLLAFLQLVDPLKEFAKNNKSNAASIFIGTYEFLVDEDLEIDPEKYYKKKSPIFFYHRLSDNIEIVFDYLTDQDSPRLKERKEKRRQRILKNLLQGFD